MSAELGLCGRREDGLRELLRLFESGGELHAADCTGGEIIFPAAADDVAAGNTFNKDGFQALADDGTAFYLVNLFGLHHGFRGDAGEVIGDDVLELLKPEVRQRSQYLALARDRIAENDVEGRDAVRRYEKQFVVADGVAVANFAAVNLLKGRDV